MVDGLDSFYCHNLVVRLRADAVANRLEGLAVHLLSAATARISADLPMPGSPS